ncbi:hypothetical protein FXN63_00820 [Pigmentiphaga aceris]|uniref:Uncharacterized protein n=1 Tax=Pigmentiphaga aceris TaxID=1940612 RepID=A0A5C0AV34_9BURK|nr:hypothetical protein [Pigmentiphaga aceris]QEI04531.1 hypothetical protein FXN63_00820 [Pigmentiphaga aceris]
MPEQHFDNLRAERREPPPKKKGKTAWQRIRFLLLLSIFPIAAAVGGIVFGQWLAVRAPVDQSAAAAAAANGPVDIRSLPLANGNGVPEPPQPRMDGSRGVPPRVANASKPIPVVSAGAAGAPVPSAPPGTTVNPGVPATVAGLVNDPSLHISTAPYVPSATPAPGTPGGPAALPSSGASGWMPQADLSPTPRIGAYAQVVPVTAGDNNDQGGFQPMPVSDAPPPSQGLSVSSRPPAGANMPAWQRVLRIALDRCEAQSSGRNACIQQARNNYCEANQGWGAVAECGP